MSESGVSGFFSAYAGTFDAIYGNRNTLLERLVNRWFRKSMRLRFERTLAACSPAAGRSILDVGCGPGHYSIALARKGAGEVLGLDIAPGMIALARSHAEQAGMANRCRFAEEDFMTRPASVVFDHVVVMGVMDYVAAAGPFVTRVLAATRRSAYFSFPAAGGPLAWQRKLRYRRRCPLFLYREEEVHRLFDRAKGFRVSVERLARDYFVTATRI